MLHSAKNLAKFKIKAKDGELGYVESFLFGDINWAVRYMVADTGEWLSGKEVLIYTDSLEAPDFDAELMRVKLNKEQIESSPSIETQNPVSRQKQVEMHRYYGWPFYWSNMGYGQMLTPFAPLSPDAREKQAQATQEHIRGQDPHLRSTKEVIGYNIHASDGSIGHIEDFLIDTADWHIRYAVVDTRNWLPGKRVLVSVDWITDISWLDRVVNIDLSRKLIKESPEYDPSKPIDRTYENSLHEFYKRPGYW